MLLPCFPAAGGWGKEKARRIVAERVRLGAEAVRRFVYRSGAFGGEEFEGVVTDLAPAYGMDRDEEQPAGKSLNEIQILGDLLRMVDSLAQRVDWVLQIVRRYLVDVANGQRRRAAVTAAEAGVQPVALESVGARSRLAAFATCCRAASRLHPVAACSCALNTRNCATRTACGVRASSASIPKSLTMRRASAAMALLRALVFGALMPAPPQSP